jgi:dihydroorotase
MVRAGLNEEQIVNSLSVRPRQILGLEVPLIEEGAVANLVVFDSAKTWSFDEKTNKSKSKNSPLFGQTLKGAVELVINNSQIIKND